MIFLFRSMVAEHCEAHLLFCKILQCDNLFVKRLFLAEQGYSIWGTIPSQGPFSWCSHECFKGIAFFQFAHVFDRISLQSFLLLLWCSLAYIAFQLSTSWMLRKNPSSYAKFSSYCYLLISSQGGLFRFTIVNLTKDTWKDTFNLPSGFI